MDIQAIRDNEIAYCKEHVEHFIETYCHIEEKEADDLIQPVKLWPEQKKALAVLGSNKWSVILKARQLGLTWLVVFYAAWVMICKTGRTVIGLSKNEDGAKELIRRMEVVFCYMPELIQPHGRSEPGWTGMTYEAIALKITIHFGSNKPDSVFSAFASSPSAGRSLTADLLLFDEWAFQQFASEIWKASFPTINRPDGGQVIGLSTIERGSLFEQIYTDNDNGFAKIFLGCFADPSRTQEWYEKTKKAMKGDITQEYPRTVEEALKVPGGSYFPEVSVDTHIVKELSDGNVIRYVILDYGFDMLSVHWVEVDENGNAILYREFDAPNQTIAAACDTILDLNDGEKIKAYLAPPDLWSRSQESGKGRDVLFYEGGLCLTKTSNDFENGCSAMKEWLSVYNGIPKLRILEDTCPNLLNSLQKVQKDKKRPNVYAKTPHDLTHDLDSLRCFCVFWTLDARKTETIKRQKLPIDIIEDYMNGNKETREFMTERFGKIY